MSNAIRKLEKVQRKVTEQNFRDKLVDLQKQITQCNELAKAHNAESQRHANLSQQFVIRSRELSHTYVTLAEMSGLQEEFGNTWNIQAPAGANEPAPAGTLPETAVADEPEAKA